MEPPVVGLRLSEDPWFAQNTLPFVFQHLEVRDLLRCSEVCRLWYDISKESSLWRSVTLRNYILNFTKTSETLARLKTVHLKIDDCSEKSHSSMLYAGLKNMPALRILEILNCSCSLITVLNEETLQLEVIRANFMYGSYGTKRNLNFVSKMANLYELKLHLYQGVQDIEEILTNLGNLKNLYLLGISNLDFRISEISRLTKNATLETLALGNCYNLTKEFCVTLKSLTALKQLRLDCCTNWNALYCLTCISEMPNLVCLELIDADIDEGFHGGIKLCINLEQLTIFPKAHRYNMGIFNTRIFVGIRNLRTTLKKFNLGYREGYLNYFQRVMGVTNQVPVSRDFHVNKLDPYRDFVKLDHLEEELINWLPYTVINIAAPGDPRSIFS